MAGRARKRFDPRRQIAKSKSIGPELKARWRCIRYKGSAHHKSKATDCGWVPSPRPGKSLCDDLRIMKMREAAKLLRAGIQWDMVSQRCCDKGFPRYIWAVDSEGEVYEAVQGSPSHHYHGYRLRQGDAMRKIILKEWHRRCST